ncbi:hypothetical protein IMG5_055010 [Ichthyophthirius multifiliis]|uniref:Activator of Hsp90 ATPase AHSA1-like N-terminal domain-containing protein n=1 Tax=Ichthyophthirius multifiliis TaxID=5932 RepID=G0QN30_ICHMU|nr:hypothetical protein IMG5_055010 [Ichthyophthirius multifiliis]EGR33359.1 hypothetical protein IMG5_055010 [Ichthyophthirius multifiliis]|eukprot:XP_004037345.1 hypothetical protein IMG5_055010 [Ichthyophthirius multifiliis]
MEKQQAAGSVWNVNSWHWEQKNYTSQANKILEEIFLSLNLEQDGIQIKHSKIKSITGDAEINVRKGKQILCYDFNIEVEFIGQNQEEECEGYYKVHGINPDDDDFEVDHITLNSKNKCGEMTKKILLKKLKGELTKVLKDLPKKIAQYENDPEKIKQNELLRQQNLQATQKARQEKGQEKELIFLEQRQKEMEMKQQFALKQ